MHKIFISVAAFAVASSASAVLDLQFTSPASKTLTLAPGASGTISGFVTGVVGDVTSWNIVNLAPANYTVSFTSNFQTYLALNTNSGYTGDILSITAGTTPGTFYGQASVRDTFPWNDSENFAVQVTPEPLSAVALSAGALALLRRRRKA